MLAEFPHLDAIVQEDLTVAIDPETQSLLDNQEPFILLTAHLGNWEVIGGWLARFGPPLTAVYAEQGVLVKVDGMGSVEDVTARVLAALGA